MILLVFLISLFMFVSCNKAVTFEYELNKAEELLYDNPDSTFKILKSIDRAEPRHTARKARYALLYVQAMDKLELDISGDTLLQQATNYYRMKGTPQERFMCFYLEGKRCIKNEDKVGAVYYLSKANALKEYADSECVLMLQTLFDSLYRNEPLYSTIFTTQCDYLSHEFIASQDREEIEKKETSFLIIILVVIVSLFFISLQEVLLSKNRNEKKYLDVIEDLHKMLNVNDSRMSEAIKVIFREQYKVLNNIGASLFNNENDIKGHKMLYREVRDIIDKFKQEKIQHDIEQKVNVYCDNVMKILRNEFPDLIAVQYTQLCLHIAGFSSKLIGVILDMSEQNVNVRKCRLKKKIAQSCVSDKDKILSYLG